MMKRAMNRLASNLLEPRKPRVGSNCISCKESAKICSPEGSLSASLTINITWADETAVSPVSSPVY